MTVRLIAIVICISWAFAIALIDLLIYRISNRSLTLGIVLVWPALYELKQNFQLSRTMLTFIALAVVTGLFSLIGMGDVKLLLFFAPWLRYDHLAILFTFMALVSWLLLLADLLLNRRFPTRIAFAPAILAAAALNMAS